MSKEYKTRDGRSVRLLCTDGPFGFPVVGIIYNLDGSPWTAASWTLNGRIEGAIASSHLNLIEVRKKFRREVWVNVYPEDKLGGNVSAFNSKETADSMADGNPRIACIKVIIEGEEVELSRAYEELGHPDIVHRIREKAHKYSELCKRFPFQPGDTFYATLSNKTLALCVGDSVPKLKIYKRTVDMIGEKGVIDTKGNTWEWNELHRTIESCRDSIPIEAD